MSFEIGHTETGVPVFPFIVSGETHACTPANTTAFVHDQRFKDADHIFIMIEDGKDGSELGLFVFRGLLAVRFNEVIDAMATEGYSVNYSEEPSEMDWGQFLKHAAGDLDEPWKHLEGLNG